MEPSKTKEIIEIKKDVVRNDMIDNYEVCGAETMFMLGDYHSAKVSCTRYVTSLHSKENGDHACTQVFDEGPKSITYAWRTYTKNEAAA